MHGCKFLKKNSPASGEIVLARVKGEYLYQSDMAGLLKNASPADSISFVASYTQAWVRRKLLLSKAEENIAASELGIDKKVEEYRQSLMLYEYEKELINQKLDKAVGSLEIADFYEKNKEKFTLESDIYQLHYVIIETEAKDMEQMRNIILLPQTDNEQSKREGYCKAVAREYYFGDSKWITSSAALGQFPISKDDLTKLSGIGKMIEYRKERYSYFIQVKKVLHTGDLSPIDYIQNQIKEVFINKKKVVLIQKIYDKIFEDGLKSGDCEILVAEKQLVNKGQ
jgi:hypothetical protein